MNKPEPQQLNYQELKGGEIEALHLLGRALSVLLNIYKRRTYAQSLGNKMNELKGTGHIPVPYVKMLLLFAEEIGKAAEHDPLFQEQMENLAKQQFVREIMGDVL